MPTPLHLESSRALPVEVADAFNSGEGLVVLAPGEEWTGTWGISPA